MAHLGFPLLGDAVYSKTKAPFKLTGQVLHASALSFVHPVKQESIHAKAPLPEYFSHLIEIMDSKES
jgi:23S rRNA pseudouridine1911/1915/1917 synthase